MSEHLTPNQERAAQIAALNDAFRKAGPTPDWLMTQGAAALPDRIGLIRAVMECDNFAEDNDPHGMNTTSVISRGTKKKSTQRSTTTIRHSNTAWTRLTRTAAE